MEVINYFYKNFGTNCIGEGVNNKTPISCGYVRKGLGPPPVIERGHKKYIFFLLFLVAYRGFHEKVPSATCVH